MSVYYRYSTYLKEKYGAKTYKLPIHLDLTCPNRDGNLGRGGCAFCGEEATAFENHSSDLPVKEQLLKNKDHIASKYKAKKFIAYFQNFTNTYLPLEQLKKYIDESLEIDEIVDITLSTRPDCVSEEYLEEIVALIAEKRPEVTLSLELGLQTVNYHTLDKVNRGHTLAELIDAVLIAKKYAINLAVHLILNLPGDKMIDVVENAKVLSALDVDNVKLHALYIREDTELGRLYQKGELEIISLEEYIERVIVFLEHLKPEIAVQRLLGRAPGEKTLFVNWGYKWWEIHDMIEKKMEKYNRYQGKNFNYLKGKALN
ncbi:TIGR01212 family radical SAM protein [Natronospora cellulosivora (SeqCode)]